jgi:hypothetical protein
MAGYSEGSIAQYRAYLRKMKQFLDPSALADAPGLRQFKPAPEYV